MAKYDVDIEGTIYPWEEDTITVRSCASSPATPPVRR
jgi:hypothetical protein